MVIHGHFHLCSVCFFIEGKDFMGFLPSSYYIKTILKYIEIVDFIGANNLFNIFSTLSLHFKQPRLPIQLILVQKTPGDLNPPFKGRFRTAPSPKFRSTPKTTPRRDNLDSPRNAWAPLQLMLIEGLEDVSRFFAPGAKTRKKQKRVEKAGTTRIMLLFWQGISIVVVISHCFTWWRRIPVYIFFSHTINVWYLTYIYHKNMNQRYHTWMAWVIIFLVCLVLCQISNCT